MESDWKKILSDLQNAGTGHGNVTWTNTLQN
jgi:hypothetical protein